MSHYWLSLLVITPLIRHYLLLLAIIGCHWLLAADIILLAIVIAIALMLFGYITEAVTALLYCQHIIILALVGHC